MHDRDLSAVTEADMAKSKADMGNDSRVDMGRGNEVDMDRGSRVDTGEGKVDMDVGETVRGEPVMAVLIENAGRYLVAIKISVLIALMRSEIPSIVVIPR